MAHYVFDVDGTLTPSRQAIDPQFNSFFCRFIDNHSVSLVTGSDIAKKRTIRNINSNRVEYCLIVAEVVFGRFKIFILMIGN